MKPKYIDKMIVDKIKNGDVVVIEYPSTFPVHEFLWDELIPTLIDEFEIVIDDFFGIGDVLFRTFLRRVPPKEYSEIMERIIGKVKVIKIGPGKVSYSNVIEEIPLTYDLSEFIKLYYPGIREVIAKASRRVIFITVGLAEYLYFGGDNALQTILLSRSILPIEDWTSVYLVNVNLAPEKSIAALEEISPLVIYLSEKGTLVKKE
ncbi:DUF257 family protein [Pyrococcus abyssi]|uniref:Uncharacterized protein n=1 Tax=Pyrococcus abyssi (strain GE5 / Orsay) TaxID=272844 RepID=Q9V1J8_PYRAB|nr:DUF257 family protein [Pyrococcus abyssi]CAB49351.1 Hypothetical protein PAB0282 [Pyrococcus abyssi GE5]CCE69810.1 TPA: hypothetical protein PAB0282 [Pyrococcus abyssi GE5]